MIYLLGYHLMSVMLRILYTLNPLDFKYLRVSRVVEAVAWDCPLADKSCMEARILGASLAFSFTLARSVVALAISAFIVATHIQ
jgi:hypothetical protein